MTNKIDIAIIGATSPVGEAILEQLVKVKFPVNTIVPLAFEEDNDSTIEFDGKNIHIKNIAEFNFTKVPLVFMCQVGNTYRAVIDRILDAGCRLIEVESNLQNAPAIVASLDTDNTLLKDSQHIRSASGLSCVLSQILNPLKTEYGLRALHFTALQSVSDKGKSGIDELAMQTTSLLNTRPIKPSVFKKQIAFNVVPNDTENNASGYTIDELDLIDELETLLFENSSDYSVMPSFIHIPVFYGVSIDMFLELEQDTDLSNFEQMISTNPDVELKSVDELITPVSHASEMDRIFINRVRQDRHDARRFNFWCVTDAIKSGSAINSVQIGEILVKHHL